MGSSFTRLEEERKVKEEAQKQKEYEECKMNCIERGKTRFKYHVCSDTGQTFGSSCLYFCDFIYKNRKMKPEFIGRWDDPNKFRIKPLK